MCRGLREGFWPYAKIDPDAPKTFDYSKRDLDDIGAAAVRDLCEEEIKASRYSEPFGPDLLPGMYSQPIGVVPKPHSADLCIVIDQSVGPHSLNSWMLKSNVSICLDNLQDFGSIL